MIPPANAVENASTIRPSKSRSPVTAAVAPSIAKRKVPAISATDKSRSWRMSAAWISLFACVIFLFLVRRIILACCAGSFGSGATLGQPGDHFRRQRAGFHSLRILRVEAGPNARLDAFDGENL